MGKSSLINALTGRKNLAKTSSTPGKTQLINHFDVEGQWMLVDLPGYGYAKVSKKQRAKFSALIENYMLTRKNLICVFVLVDSRIPPQKIDLEFMEFLGENDIPFVMVFTKIDKLSSSELQKNLKAYQNEMLKSWTEMPQNFKTSAESKLGVDELTRYIENLNNQIKGFFVD